MPIERTVREIPGRLSRLKSIPFLNRFSESSHREISPDEAKGFLASQKLAYRCAVTIGRELQPGWTEQKTAQLMDNFLQDHGVKTFFHRSFAWFGERSSFQGFQHYLKFLPARNRVLQEGDVVILDTAPVVNGFSGDIGFTFSKTPNAELAEARKLLLEFRDEIPMMFAGRFPPREIWAQVDRKIRKHGFENCHQKYPLGALGHRLHQVPLSHLPGVVIPFSLHAYWSLLSRGLFPEVLGPWHDGPKEGLWAIEPHFGNAKFGIKFEEILLVRRGEAEWLQKDPPHVKLPEGFY